MTLLSADEVDAALGGLTGWVRDGLLIVKEYRLADFPAAVALVVRIGFEAEAHDHHPDLDLRYNRVRVALSTHSEGGITAKDVALAAAIEALAGGG